MRRESEPSKISGIDPDDYGQGPLRESQALRALGVEDLTDYPRFGPYPLLPFAGTGGERPPAKGVVVTGPRTEKRQVAFLDEAVLSSRAGARLAQPPDSGFVQGGKAGSGLRKVTKDSVHQLPWISSEVLGSRLGDEEQAAQWGGEEVGADVCRGDGGPPETTLRGGGVDGAFGAGEAGGGKGALEGASSGA